VAVLDGIGPAARWKIDFTSAGYHAGYSDQTGLVAQNYVKLQTMKRISQYFSMFYLRPRIGAPFPGADSSVTSKFSDGHCDQLDASFFQVLRTPKDRLCQFLPTTSQFTMGCPSTLA
jgi:hypothetical protein